MDNKMSGSTEQLGKEDSLIKPPEPESLIISVKRRSVVGDINLRQTDKIKGIVVND